MLIKWIWFVAAYSEMFLSIPLKKDKPNASQYSSLTIQRKSSGQYRGVSINGDELPTKDEFLIE